MNEKLLSTLNKVLLLAKQNAEFGDELRKALGINSTIKFDNINHERVENIEKYLGLDYYVDYKSSIIDYSFVKIPEVRALLISDNREMLRFRYGTRYHKIDFSEYCRYAQLQSEMLLNYYYEQKNSTFAEIKQHILTYNSKAIIPENIKELTSIPYNTKLWAFRNEYKIRKQSDIWEYVREVRNEQSHRSLEKDQITIDEYKHKLQELNIPIKQDGNINWYKISSNPQLKTIYDNQIYNTPEFKRYCYLLWYKDKPYDTIVEALIELSLLIKKSLTNF
ncbi:MAG: hypothetical protein IJZ45_08550 [Bacteroidaceae bacterium]|nr:hypothetical protein [Bacteroidaceae bacterium]